jgi:mRNA interferase RelE/StbE
MARLPTEVQSRIAESLQSLSEEPRPPGSRKLQGRGGWRIRVSDYRAIYEIDDEAREVLVVAVGHRRDIYR